ncbi:MAG: EAL domain-containing protein [Oleiphilaceae bacterium]|nr:EAL domain-containing protein [Oleiphilaceae bacterium]
MTKQTDTLFLLVLEDSQNDAEKLVSLLRNAGIATRAKLIEDEEELEQALSDGQWDLFVARESAADFDLSQACIQISKKDLYIPLIIISEEYDEEKVSAHLKSGAHDVVSSTQEKHFVEVVKRELSHVCAIQKLHHLEVEIRDVEHRCELLLDSSKDAIAYINDGMHIYANSSYLEFLDYDDIDEMICIPVMDTLSGDSQEKFKEIGKDFLNSNSDAKPVENVSLTSIREDGTEIPVLASFSHASYDGESCLQIILRPEENSAELEAKLKEMSQIDLLTGLYNRSYFMDALHESKEGALSDDSKAAVYYLAIDHFHSVKANLGIGDADFVLRDLAQILETKKSDKVTLARLSDDVFGMIINDTTDAQAMDVANSLCKEVEDHLFDVEGKTVQVTLSIGVTIINANAPNIKDILGRAQTASEGVRKLEGKANGNGALLFEPKVENPLGNHDTAGSYIEKALDEDKFKLLFQPIQSLRGGTHEHYEAFVRMIDDKGQEVSPYEFLPPNGPSEVAGKIDKWVILQTIKQLSEHRSQGHDTRLFINLTAESLQDPNFISWLNVALKAARLPGDSLIFQISENNAITYLKQAKEFEKGLNTLHCNLSVNQFGRAINPFNLLKHLTPEYVKLEGSFTEEMQKSPEGKEAMKEVITSLQGMNKLTVVPLVESASLLATLWQAGVNYIQGYYLQAPSTEMNFDFSEE